MRELYIGGFINALLKIIFVPLGVLLFFSLPRIREAGSKLRIASEWRFFAILLFIVFAVRFYYCVRIIPSGAQRYEAPLLIFCLILAIPGFGSAVSMFRKLLNRFQYTNRIPCVNLLLLAIILLASTAKALHPPRYKSYLHDWRQIIEERCSQTNSRNPILFDLIGDSTRMGFYYNMRGRVVPIHGNLTKDRYREDFLQEFDKRVKSASLTNDQIFVVVSRNKKTDIIHELRNNFPVFPYRRLAKWSGKHEVFLYCYDYELVAELSPNVLSPTATLKNRVKLVMPPEIYVTAGSEVNVYFDNLLLVPNIKNYNIEVNCNYGKQYSDRWNFHPGREVAGEEFTLEISIMNAFNWPVAKGRSVVHVVPGNGHNKNSVSILQASLFSHYNFFPKYIRSVWGSDGSNAGIILRDKKDKFLLQWVCFSKGAPRIVYLLLNLSGAVNLHKANYFGYISKLIDRKVTWLQKKYKNISIGICLPVVPAASQDYYAGFKITRWQLKMNQHRLVQHLIKCYGGRQRDGIYVVPVNVCVDGRKDYAGSKNVLLLGDNGYQKMAREICAWIGYVLQKKNTD